MNEHCTLVNHHARTFHLPMKFRGGGEALVWVDRDDRPATRRSDRYRQVPNDGESFRCVLPGATTDKKLQVTEPGRVVVPGWYLAELVKERGWRARLSKGGGVEVEGGKFDEPVDLAQERIRELEIKLRDARAQAVDPRLFDSMKNRIAELEATLAARTSESAKTEGTPEQTKPKPKEPKDKS